MTMHSTHGEASYHLATAELDLDVTGRGGHLAPVVFHLDGRDVSPYALAPWEPAEYPDLPSLLAVLRGDFLCLPFGGQLEGPPHSETANCAWTKLDSDERSLRFGIETNLPDGDHHVPIMDEMGQKIRVLLDWKFVTPQ